MPRRRAESSKNHLPPSYLIFPDLQAGCVFGDAAKDGTTELSHVPAIVAARCPPPATPGPGRDATRCVRPLPAPPPPCSPHVLRTRKFLDFSPFFSPSPASPLLPPAPPLEEPPLPQKFHSMEVEFAIFPRHGTQIPRFFHAMEVKFSKSSTPWNPLLSPLTTTPPQAKGGANGF